MHFRTNTAGRIPRRYFVRGPGNENAWRFINYEFFRRDAADTGGVVVLPPTTVLEAIEAGLSIVTSRADIYEADGTPWYLNAPVIDGSVSIDGSRDERRTASLTLANVDGAFRSRPGGFWYDKVIRLYRGVEYFNQQGQVATWEAQLGEFYIDDIDIQDHPSTVSVTLRDATRKLLQAKFAQSTAFPKNHPIEEVIRTIAINGGIPAAKIDLPLTGKSTTREFLFDRTTERWKAITEIANAYNYDVYFRGVDGRLTMEPFRDPADPAVSPSEYVFQAGGRDIRNGGFELLLDGNSFDWWVEGFQNYGAGVAVAIETDPMHVYRGQYAMRHDVTTADAGAVASTPVEVNPGDVWEITAASKGDRPDLNGKYLRVVFGSTPDFTMASGSISLVEIVENGNWTAEYTVDTGTVTVPAGAKWMRVVTMSWAASPTATAYRSWWDEVHTRRLSPANDTKGNIVSFKKRTGSARIYNHVVVTGEATDVIPVWAQAENNNPDSPTRIAKLGRRTFFYTSAFITTEAQAQAVADRFLGIHALEQFDVSLESLVVPFLDANIIVEFYDPDGSAADPVRFLFSDLQIPLQPGTMSSTARRVTLVG